MYKGNFNSKNGNTYTVNIHAGTGTKELIMALEPAQISYDDNDVFKPLKLSGATFRFITDSVPLEIFTGVAQGVKAELLDNKGIVWQGYLTPNIYNQDYLKFKAELELECVDALSTLEYVKYEPKNKDFRTFDYLIGEAIKATGYTFGIIRNYNSLTLDTYSISDQNWQDEDGEWMNWKEILEEIMKYLGLSMYQVGNNIVIADMDKAASVTGSDLSNRVTIDSATISLSEVYNKISINSSLYSAESFTYDIMDDDNTFETGVRLSGKVDTTNYQIKTMENKKIQLVSGIPPITEDFRDGMCRDIVEGKARHEKSYNEFINIQERDWERVLACRINKFMSNGLIAQFGNGKVGAFKGGYFVLNAEWLYQDFDSPFPRTDNVTTRRTTADSKFLYIKLSVGEWHCILGYSTSGYPSYRWEKNPAAYNANRLVSTKYDEGDSINLWHNLKPSENYYDNTLKKTGFYIPLPDGIMSGGDIMLYGEVKLSIYSSPTVDMHQWQFVKNLKLEYAPLFDKSVVGEIPIGEYEDSDTIYETIVDMNNIQEFDELDLKVTTKTPKGASFSCVLNKISTGYEFLGKVTRNGKELIMEHHLLNKLYDQHHLPRIVINAEIIGECLINDVITIGEFPNKKFIISAIEYNVADNITNTTLTEYGTN